MAQTYSLFNRVNVVLLLALFLDLSHIPTHTKKTVVNYEPSKDDSPSDPDEPYKNAVYGGEKNMEDILDNPQFRYRKADLGDDPNLWGDALSAYDTMLKFRENRQLDAKGKPSKIYQPGLFVPWVDLTDSFAARRELPVDPDERDHEDKIKRRLAGRNNLVAQPPGTGTANVQNPSGSGPSVITTNATTTTTPTTTVRPTRPPMQCLPTQASKRLLENSLFNVTSLTAPVDQLKVQDRLMDEEKFYDTIYDNCGEKNGKVCYEMEKDCVRKRRCRMLATFKRNGPDRVSVTLLLTDTNKPANPYIGFGFSTDPYVGNDYLFYCIDTRNVANVAGKNVALYMSRVDANHKTTMQVNRGDYLSSVCLYKGYSAPGILACSFDVANVIALDDGTEVDVMTQKFHQLLTFGHYIRTNKDDPKFGAIDKSDATIFSNTPFSLEEATANPAIINSKSLIFIILHTAFACVAFIFLIPSGIIVAKFGREVYGHKTKAACCKLPRWLLIHIRMGLASFVFILLSVLFILIDLDFSWQSLDYYPKIHSILGFVAWGLFFIDFTLGWFFKLENSQNSVEMPKTWTKIMAWLHWALGNSTYFSGTFCVLIAGRMQRAFAPCMVEYFGYVHLVIFVGVLAFMSIDTCRLVKQLDGRYMFQRALLGPMIPFDQSDVPKSSLSSSKVHRGHKRKDFSESSAWKMRRRVMIFHFITSFLCAFAIFMLMILPTVLCRENFHL